MKKLIIAMLLTASTLGLAQNSRAMECSGIDSLNNELSIVIVDKEDLSRYEIELDDLPAEMDVAVVGNYKFGDFFGAAKEEGMPEDMFLESYKYSGFADELGFFELQVTPDVFNPKNNLYSVKIYDVDLEGGFNMKAGRGDLIEEIKVQCR